MFGVDFKMEHYIRQYFSMNVAHLLQDELDNELIVRNIDPSSDSRTVQERKCRAELKKERDLNLESVEYETGWDDIMTELDVCNIKVHEISKILQDRKEKSAPDQKYKTRLLHLLFRILRAKSHATDDSVINTIGDIAGHAARLLGNYYSLLSPHEEVRKAELELASNSMRAQLENLNKTPQEEDATPETSNHDGNPNPEESNNTGEKATNTSNLSNPQNPQQTAEMERLKDENTALKNLFNDLFTHLEKMDKKIEKLEAEKENPPVNKNSTQFQNSKDLSDSPKPKFSYQEFLDWLVKDQNLIGKSSKTNQQKKPDLPKITKNNHSEQEHFAKNSFGKRLPIHEWKIRYDGSDQGRQLNEFLKEVEFNARSEGFSKQELYNSAYHLFQGKARSWYMEINSNNELETWENLVKELKQEFLPPDLDFYYERQAHMRKQRQNERFQDYFLDMTRIFRNLTCPIDEEKKFNMIFRNLRTEYKSAMLAAKIKTIPAMKEFGKNFDSINWQWYAKTDKDNFRGQRSGERQVNEIQSERRAPMNTNGNNYNNNRPWSKGENFKREFKNSNRPNSNFRNDRNETNTYKPQQQTSEKSTEKKPLQNSGKPDEVKPGPSKNLNTLEKILKAYVPIRRGTCFNCHNFGHNFNQCKQPVQVFCEVCGFPGFSTPDCPYCPTKNVTEAAQ